MINPTLRIFLLPLLFFASGFAGLVYEVIWTRQLLLIFGSTTHSVVAVLAAFMGGLALGSFWIGRIADRTQNLLRLYSLLELTVGVSALATLLLFPFIQLIYQWSFTAFGINTYILLILKFFLTAFVLLPATSAMGGTLPVLVRFLLGFSPHISKAVSYLYAVNTFGAVAGVILAGFVFIELFGLRLSLLLAFTVNIFIGVVSWQLSKDKWFSLSFIQMQTKKLLQTPTLAVSPQAVLVALLAFSVSGFISLAYEVLWTRLLTPSVGTYIYAFSAILGVYLLGIAAGSLLYRFLVDRLGHTLLVFGIIELGIGLSAVASVVASSGFLALATPVKVLVTILPGTLLMGMSFPVVTKLFQEQKRIGRDIGVAYSLNTVGTILGSVGAAFLLIPILGTVKSILTLALVNYVLGVFLVIYEKHAHVVIKSFLVVFGFIVVAGTVNLLSQPALTLQEAKLKEYIQSLRGNYEVRFMEDEVASVLGYRQKDGGDAALIIDGVQTTSLGPETTLLAHLPIFLHKDPRDMLVIAFGMGSTYRSALLHENIRVDAVDLVPSVPKMFDLFHDDAQQVLDNPRGTIIINDGRNYVKMTNKQYDIIVIDPPPPINAAHTTVLYSKEFYEDAKKRLKPDGIFVAWFYTGARVDDFRMLFRSFYETFSYMVVVQSPEGWGYYVFGSEMPIEWDRFKLEESYLQKFVYQYVNRTLLDPTRKQHREPLKFDDIQEGFIGDKSVIEKFVKDVPPITDDHPWTEYFLIRQKRKFWPMVEKEWIERTYKPE